ncbi:MAG: HEAT repeat domain-containing protein [Planctomycetota bacterium]
MLTMTPSSWIRRSRAFLPVLGTLFVLGALLLAKGPESGPPRRQAVCVRTTGAGVASVPAVAAPQRPLAELRYRWVAGEEWDHACSFRQSVEILPSQAFLDAAAADGLRVDAPRPETGSLELAARLRVRVYAELGEDWLVGYRFHDVRFVTGAASIGLDDEVLARVSQRGEMMDLRFDAATGVQERDMTRALLAAQRIVLSADGASAWQTEEMDPLGASCASYASAPAPDGRSWLVEKRRTSIETGAAGASVGVQGGTDAVLSTETGRVASLRTDETITLDGEGQPCVVRSGVSASFELAGPVGAIPAGEADRARAEFDSRRAADFRPEGAREAGDVARSKFERDLAAGATLDGVLAGLDTARSTGRWQEEVYDRFLELRALFRQDADTVRRARTILLAAGTYDEAVLGALIDALGSAGTAEAQEALISAVEDGSIGSSLREAAILSATQVESPSEEFVAGLRRVMRGSAGDDALASRAMEALGIAAGRMAESGRDADAIVAELEGALVGAVDPVARRAAVVGLGNAAAPRSASVLLRAAKAEEDETVRAAAALALRAIPGAEARSALGRLAAEDSSASVRRAAMQALSFAPDAAADEAARNILDRDGSALVRAQAVHHLAAAATGGAAWARGLLERVAVADASEDVRDGARRAIDGLAPSGAKPR